MISPGEVKFREINVRGKNHFHQVPAQNPIGTPAALQVIHHLAEPEAQLPVQSADPKTADLIIHPPDHRVLLINQTEGNNPGASS